MKAYVNCLWLIITAVAVWIADSSSCNACLLDWMFPRRVERPVYAVYYPSAPVTSGCVCPAPTTCGYVSGAACAAPAAAPVATYYSYAPQTRFRTVWARVPVTSFRPVVATSAACPTVTTALQPCTSYTWQAQRVPYLTLFPQIPSPGWPVCANGACAAPAYASCPTTEVGGFWSPVATYGTSPCVGCDTDGTTNGCPTCAPPAPSATWSESATENGGAIQATPWTAVSPTTPEGAAPVPADQPPTLQPQESTRPLLEDDSRWPNGGQLNGTVGGALTSGVATDAEGTYRSGLSPPRTVPYVRPIPDPDRQPARVEDSSPELRDQGQRMADRTEAARFDAVPISWVDSRQAESAVRPAVAEEPTSWDEGGWRPVRDSQ
jgi:hypothetical protein